ncbi:MAG: CrcB family protein [Cryobacterium sp.]|nr:CrcB family protein [Cryobacterium sp.]
MRVALRSVGLVAVGGAAGTAAREAITLAVPAVGSFPLATFGINVGGAFLLGLLLEFLARQDDEVGRRRSIRLLLGTGFLGGFTTYSALATESALLVGDGALALALAYALGSLVGGGVASWLGIVAGAWLNRPAVAR